MEYSCMHVVWSLTPRSTARMSGQSDIRKFTPRCHARCSSTVSQPHPHLFSNAIFYKGSTTGSACSRELREQPRSPEHRSGD